MDDSQLLSPRSAIPGHLLYLERPRLDALLTEALRSPVVLVLGGAGYGKTHAVYSYLQKYKILTVWLQFTERDNFGDRFWENFCNSVSKISQSSADRLARHGFPATERQFQSYLSIPLEDVDTRVKYVFVYDDLHLVSNETVLRFLERSISSPFPNITSILISRKELPFNLMKLFSKGLLAEISEKDVRFTRSETEDFFARQGLSVPGESLDRIQDDTEGWAFAIHLAGLFLKNGPEGTVYRAQALHSTIYQLLKSEVIEGLPPDTRKFLIRLTLVDDPSTELVKALALLHAKNEKDAEALIHQIEDIGSFIRFDDYRHTFSLHRLFRNYLRELQGELTAEEKTETWRAAGEWCEANRQKMDALDYYEKAEMWDRLMELAHSFPMWVPNDTVKVLVAALEKVPEEVYDRSPIGYLVLTRFLLSAGRFAEARAKLADIIAQKEKLPETPENSRLLLGLWNNLGFISKLISPRTGVYDFPEHYAKGKYWCEKWGGTISGPMTVASVGGYACRVGSAEPADMARYIDALVRSVPDAAFSMNGCMTGMVELARGEVALFAADMEKAKGFIREAAARAHEWNQYEIEARASYYLMRVAAYQGDLSIIDECIAIRTALMEKDEFLNRHLIYDVYRGWLYAHIAMTDKVSPWIMGSPEEKRINSLLSGMEFLVRAKAYLSDKECQAALLALERAKESMGMMLFGKIEIGALEAVCLYQLRKKAEAYAVLEAARLLAEPGGYWLPFAELGKDMRALASQALKEKAHIPREFLERIGNLSSSYAKKLHLIAEHYSGRTEKKAVLSEKESEVLVLLFQGLTQDEIAGNSGKSVNTVKSIIKRIYEKLGAVNKADAIRIAMNRGILDWEAASSDKKKPAPPPKKTALRPLLIDTARKG